ncbi:MAG TPA: 16S rRNA (cytosine(967)-C(5))-methyltransferase [Gammaproteobacteria bacterium]|nr:16S rRNA (cytosine(967)-C(5))-methyltransferase [Gammaproteobacteria bacterium]
MPTAEVCAAAARIVHDVTAKGRSLEAATTSHLPKGDVHRGSETREIAWGAVRWWFRYDRLLSSRLHRPIRRRDRILQSLIICGLYQLDHLREPDYAITSGTVDAASLLGASKAKGLVNAVLRARLRDGEVLPQDEETDLATPGWLIKLIRDTWPYDWREILSAFNDKPPMTLRINPLKRSRDDYLRVLQNRGIKASACNVSPWGVTLETPVNVDELFGFEDGTVSVQDAAAQATPLVCAPRDGARVLDACAAPGGKTTHLLEYFRQLGSLVALDLPDRCGTINDNLSRLGLSAKVIAADLFDVDSWWDGIPFDLILLDAPCSGTGVIRRHPDIRHHRRPADIAHYAAQQKQMLRQLWQILAPKGEMVYVTCSILMQENDEPIRDLCVKSDDVQLHHYSLPGAIRTDYGMQFLPDSNQDGLYYASLRKV